MESLDAKLIEAVVHDFTHRWRLPVSQTSSPTLSEESLAYAGFMDGDDSYDPLPPPDA